MDISVCLNWWFQRKIILHCIDKGFANLYQCNAKMCVETIVIQRKSSNMFFAHTPLNHTVIICKSHTVIITSFKSYWATHMKRCNRRQNMLVAGQEVDNLSVSLWRHNEGHVVSNHMRLECFLNRLFRRRLHKNIKAPRYWHLRGKSTGDRWFPLTKGQ